MKMNKETKEKWVAALRSGDYAQGEGSLCCQDYNPKEYHFCCLGVLCDISNPNRWHHEETSDSQYWFENDIYKDDMPTEDFLESLGISWDTAETLASMNDGGLPFSEIATYIEENL
jgi:hypothetical protein